MSSTPNEVRIAAAATNAPSTAQTGTGTLTLSNTNTYSGSTTITTGTLLPPTTSTTNTAIAASSTGPSTASSGSGSGSTSVTTTGINAALAAARTAAINIQTNAEDTILTQFASTALTMNSGENLGSRVQPRLTNVNLVAPYRVDAALPAMPVCFPYNADGIMAIDVAVRLPVGTSNLPAGVRELLVQHNINMSNLEVNFCVQDMPATWATQQILLRPHPFLHNTAPRNAPPNANFAAASTVLAGICDINTSFGALAQVPNISSHGENGADVVFSTREFALQAVNPANEQANPIRNNVTNCFYSIFIEASTGRAALTLHWLVDEATHNRLFGGFNNIVRNSRTMDDFINNLAAHDSPFQTHSANEISPAEALYALVHGNQPRPAQRLSRYMISEQLALTPSAQLQRQQTQLAQLQAQLAQLQEANRQITTATAGILSAYNQAEARAAAATTLVTQLLNSNTQLQASLAGISSAYQQAEARCADAERRAAAKK